jgi:transglutaminase-like putative cysteine protease
VHIEGVIKGLTSTIRRGKLAPGPAGTRQTVAIMRRLARAGARDLAVRTAAISAVKRAGIRPMDYRGELDAIFRFVRDEVRYTRDPVSVEVLQTPVATLKRLAGDCDDKSVLLAAMIESIGHPSQLAFRVIGTRPGGNYSHVYVVAKLGGRLIPLDPTPAGAKLGWEYPNPTLKGDIRL